MKNCLVLVVFWALAITGSSDVWYSGYEEHLDADVTMAVVDICSLHDDVYMLVGPKLGIPRVLRLESESCSAWQDVSPPFLVGGNVYVGFLAVFDDRMYVGGSNLGVFSTGDGENWERIPDLPVDKYATSAVGGGRLVICAGGVAYSTTNGANWVQGSLSAVEPNIHQIESLAYHAGTFYAGASIKDYSSVPALSGVCILSSTDGLVWSVVYRDFPSGGFQHIHGMISFQGMLYFGQYHGGGVFRTVDFAVVDFLYANLPLDIVGFAEYDGKLYASGNHTFPSNNGDPIVFVSEDGSSWSTLVGAPVNTNNVFGSPCMVSIDDKLLVGTEVSGTGNKLNLHVLAQQAPPPCGTEEMFTALIELDELMAASETTSPLWDVGRYYITDSAPFVESLPPVDVVKQVFGQVEDGLFPFLDRLIVYPGLMDEVETEYLGFVDALEINDLVAASNHLATAHTSLVQVITNVAAAVPPRIIDVDRFAPDETTVAWTNAVMPSCLQFRTNLTDGVAWGNRGSWYRATGGKTTVNGNSGSGYFRVNSYHWHPSDATPLSEAGASEGRQFPALPAR